VQRVVQIAGVWVALLTLASPALAVEPPRVQASLVRQGEALWLELEAGHTGGLPLHDVFPRIHFGDETLELERQPVLPIGASARWSHRFEAKERAALLPASGTAPPLRIRVHYHDGTGYPFSVPSVLLPEPQAASPLDATLELLGPPERPRAELTLRNPSDRAQAGVASFFSAIELAARPERVPFQLDAGARTTLVSELRAEGALGGSYPVFAIVQPAEPGAGSLVLSQALQVRPAMLERPPLRRRAAALGALVATLFLLTALLELRAARATGQPARG
jgi:hypothetical protein